MPVTDGDDWCFVPDPLAGTSQRRSAVEALGDLITADRFWLVEVLTARPVLCRIVDWHWNFVLDPADVGRGEKVGFEALHAGFICELAELSTAQLEVLEVLLGDDWGSTIAEAMDVARRLA